MDKSGPSRQTLTYLAGLSAADSLSDTQAGHRAPAELGLMDWLRRQMARLLNS